MKLLLAEDEEALARPLITILQHSGYEVEHANNGETALAMISAKSYDGVIMDIMMPKLSGIEVLTTLRSSKNFIPVLLLTAKGEVEDRVNGLDAGANDYLTKPFAMNELLARVRAMLRTAERSTKSVLEYQNIVLDLSSYELKGPSSSIRLCKEESEMLGLLIQQSDSPIDSSSLLQKVWTEDPDSDSDTTDIYASYLKKKLDSVHATFTILSDNTTYRLEDKTHD